VLLENAAAANETLREISVTVQEHLIVCCRFSEAVKLLEFLLSPYSLTGIAIMCRTELFVTLQENVYLL
jgi:hypothetical protein